jgi:hypothetical protein
MYDLIEQLEGLYSGDKYLHEYTGDELFFDAVCRFADNPELCKIAYDVVIRPHTLTETDVHLLYMFLPAYWKRAVAYHFGRAIKNNAVNSKTKV